MATKATGNKTLPLTEKQADRLVELGLSLHDEDSLVEAIRREFPGLWEGDGWLPLGGSVGKVAVTKTQQSRVSAAVKELSANSIDALMERVLDLGISRRMLTKQRREEIRRMDPTTAWQAAWPMVEKLFPGKSVDDLLQVGLCGDRSGTGKDRPSVIFADQGSGRNPEEFEASFLSVADGEKNKMSVECLMGQYGMGSTGIHAFSGRMGIKLILSRREADSRWGVALLRYGAASNIECLMPGGKLPESGLELIRPFRAADGAAWSRRYGDMARGTAVKCFSVGISGHEEERGRALNWFAAEQLGNMRFSRLPGELNIRYVDMRYADSSSAGTKGGADTRLSRGLFGQIEADAKKYPEQRVHEIRAQDDFYGILTLRAFDFGERAKERVSQYGLGACRIFHHIHGQAHFLETREALVRAELGDLSDRIVVEVDASAMGEAAAARVWMSNRESVVSNEVGAGYKELVRQALAGDATLRAWALEELRRKVGESEGEANEAVERAEGILGSAGRKAGKGGAKVRKVTAALADLAREGEEGWEGWAKGCLEAVEEKAFDAAESLEEAEAAARSGLAAKKPKAKAKGKASKAKKGSGEAKPRDPKAPGRAALSPKAKKAYAKGSGGARLEKAVRADGSELESGLFRVASCDGKTATLVAAPGREEEACEALAGQEVVFVLSVESEGKKAFFSARGVYRGETEQLFEDISRGAEREARARGKRSDRVILRGGRASAPKAGDQTRRDLRREAGFDPSMAVFCEAAGDKIVITSNIDHSSFRGLPATPEGIEIGGSWESAALALAGHMALAGLAAAKSPEEIDNLARSINAVAAGMGSGLVAALGLAIDGRKGKRARRKAETAAAEAQA